MYADLIQHYAAGVQAELRKSVLQLKEQVCPTRNSLKSGTGARGEAGRLAGLEIPYYQGVPHGSTALDAIGGTTSFERFIPAVMNKMYVGLAQMGFTVEWEYFHEHDASKGLLPETRMTQRDRVMLTYMKEQNWYACGINFGTLAVVSVGGGSGTITFTADGTARSRSKGSIRLAVSYNTSANKRILYESYTTSTDTKTATFYITSKAAANTAVVVVTDGGTLVAGDVIVKAGHYKKVPYGLGYHISSTGRLYQGTSTTTDPFLNSRDVPAGGPVTPTVIDTAKLALEVRANEVGARKKRVCHLTHGHYRNLSAYGYNLRQYNAEKGGADTTYGLPRNFEDEDTVWVQDGDMEDAYLYMRDKSSYFEYRQADLNKISKGDGTQYVGTNSFGSTEFFDNYGESYNLAWDARGDDGKGGQTNANSSVVISGATIPAINQYAEGLSLV